MEDPPLDNETDLARFCWRLCGSEADGKQIPRNFTFVRPGLVTR